MTQVSRSTFAANLASKLANNTSGDITAQDVRETITDLEDSAVWYDEVPKTGADADYVSGTAGTSGNIVMWNADGDAVDSTIASSNVLVAANLGVTVQAYDADTLKADTADNLTAGFTTTVYDIGTVSTGTTTPDFANGNIQTLTNNGAFTLAVPTGGSGTMILEITNGASPGLVTLSAFSSITGDGLTVTTGEKFLLSIAVVGARSYLNITAASDN